MAETPPSPTQKLIAALWQRNQPQTLERLDLLDRAATDPALRDEAIAIAHKLAGSLGMFGFPQGTTLARELEHHLESAEPDPATIATLASQLRLILFPAIEKKPLP